MVLYYEIFFGIVNLKDLFDNNVRMEIFEVFKVKFEEMVGIWFNIYCDNFKFCE